MEAAQRRVRLAVGVAHWLRILLVVAAIDAEFLAGCLVRLTRPLLSHLQTNGVDANEDYCSCCSTSRVMLSLLRMTQLVYRNMHSLSCVKPWLSHTGRVNGGQ